MVCAGMHSISILQQSRAGDRLFGGLSVVHDASLMHPTTYCRGVVGDSRVKVFASFFKKKRLLALHKAASSYFSSSAFLNASRSAQASRLAPGVRNR